MSYKCALSPPPDNENIYPIITHSSKDSRGGSKQSCQKMTRLTISFNARVPTLHPSLLMTLLSLFSVLRLFGISVTLATPTLTDLDPTAALATFSSEAQKALGFAVPDPGHLLAPLGPILSPDAKTALQRANIDPGAAIAHLAPVLTPDAISVLEKAHINPAESIASVAPVLPTAAFNPSAISSQAAAAAPLHAEALTALAHAMTEGISSTGGGAVANGALPGAAVHHDISAQVCNGTLSKEGALAAHAALYSVVPPFGR